jgi:hypothetical protein
MHFDVQCVERVVSGQRRPQQRVIGREAASIHAPCQSPQVDQHRENLPQRCPFATDRMR